MRLIISLSNKTEKDDKKETKADKKLEKAEPIPAEKPPTVIEQKPVSTEEPEHEIEDPMSFDFEQSPDVLAKKALDRTKAKPQARMRLNTNRVEQKVKSTKRNFADAMFDLEDPHYKVTK